MSKKLLKVILISAAVLVAGGLVYETITSLLSESRSSKLVATLRADNKRISGELTTAQGRVVELQGSVEDLKRSSGVIKDELDRSKEIARGLREENNRLESELGRSREAAAGLGVENSRLRDALINSIGGTNSLTESNRLLGESLDRAIGIVDKITSGF